jgi:hypothetical protein
LKLTNERQPRHLLQGTRQTAQEGDDCANNAEYKRASAVAGDGVHGDGKGQKMTRHDEDEEEDLADAHEFASECAAKDFSCVGHGHDVGVFQFHLSDHVAGPCCEETEDDDEDN